MDLEKNKQLDQGSGETKDTSDEIVGVEKPVRVSNMESKIGNGSSNKSSENSTKVEMMGEDIPRNLSGSSKKRFKWLLKQGCDKKDAYKLCILSIQEREKLKPTGFLMELDKYEELHKEKVSCREKSVVSSTDSCIETEKKSDCNSKGLNGASRRRLKWLLNQGYNGNEAFKLCPLTIEERKTLIATGMKKYPTDDFKKTVEEKMIRVENEEDYVRNDEW